MQHDNLYRLEWSRTYVGDYVLGTKSGAFGQILAFAVSGILVLDHIKPGPTIAGTQEDEERIVRLFDVTSGDFLEFPYAGKLVGTNGLAFDGALDTTLTLVGEGRFSEKVLVNRSSYYSTNCTVNDASRKCTESIQCR